MSPKEIWNRGNNLLAVAILGLSGFAFAPELHFESEIPFKIDEGLLLLLGLSAIGWYMWGKNKWQHAILPVLMMYLAFGIKLMGVFIEYKDIEDVGDDFGAVVLFFLASLLVTFLYVKAKRVFSK